MKLHQRLLIVVLMMGLLLVFLGVLGPVLVGSLLDELRLAWTLASVPERSLADVRPGVGIFQGRLEASAAQLSPSGSQCVVWQATAQWRFRRGRGSSFVSCTQSGVATGLVLRDGALRVPIVAGEDERARSAPPSEPHEQALRRLSVALATPWEVEQVPANMHAACGIAENQPGRMYRNYSEVCMPAGAIRYAIGCRSERGLEPCGEPLILSDRSRRQMAQAKLADMSGGSRLLLVLGHLLGLLLLGGLFQKLYPVPPRPGRIAPEVPRADGAA